MIVFRRVAFALVCLCLGTGPAGAAEPYRLSEAERAGLRALAGLASYRDLDRETPFRLGLSRVFKAIARPLKGAYHGSSKITPYDSFDYSLSMPDATDKGRTSVVEQDRYFVTFGCQHSSCDTKGSFVVDLKTGDVVMAVLPGFDRDGRRIEAGVLALFMKSCVDPDLRNFAGSYYAAWAEWVEGPLFRGAGVVDIRTTKC